MEIKRVVVIGLGYVGLPTAAILASRGLDVVGVDVNDEAISIINNGYSHIIEPDLDTIVKSVVQVGKLKAVNKVQSADAFMIAVPTPLIENNKPDLSFIKACIEPIAEVLRPGNLIILESTSPVGTTEELSIQMSLKRSDLKFPHEHEEADIAIAHCPERILPGKVLRELVENDRIIGGVTKTCADKAAKLYESFTTGKSYLTTAKTAEMVKLSENAYRDVNIAFANELSIVCDKHGVNPYELIELTNKHPRVSILSPGPGVGGHCIAVDPWFIVDGDPENTWLIKTARKVNERKIEYIVDKICEAVIPDENPIVSCFGLTYKADIDDLRESPSVKIVNSLVGKLNNEIYVVDPYINELPDELKLNSSVRLVTVDEALKNSNVIALLVEHAQFKKIPLEKLADKSVIDTRGMWRRENHELPN